MLDKTRKSLATRRNECCVERMVAVTYSRCEGGHAQMCGPANGRKPEKTEILKLLRGMSTEE